MQLMHAKQRLLTAKGELEARLAHTQKHFHRETPLSANSHEQAVETGSDVVVETLDAEAHQELQQVNHALRRLESGEYLYCGQCGKAIGEQRLALLPFTDLCIGCARNP